MSVRELKYTVGANNVTPNSIQNGGQQYEDNATTVIFNIDSDYLAKLKELNANLLYRIDFNSSAAGYDPSENLSEDALERAVPYKFTCNGGNMTATLVVTATDENGTNTNTVLSQSVVIAFESVKRNEISQERVEQNLSAMENKLRKDLEEGAFQGPKGDKGDKGDPGERGANYVLTEADKNEIADIVQGMFIDVSGVGR